MADLTWLQAQVPRDEWDNLNKRRLKLKLKWADILLPAVQQYLEALETAQPAATPDVPVETKSKTEGKKRTKKGKAEIPLHTPPTLEESAEVAAIGQQQDI